MVLTSIPRLLATPSQIKANVRVFYEVDLGRTTADVVLLTNNKSPQSSAVRPLNTEESVVFSSIIKRKIARVSDLKKIFVAMDLKGLNKVLGSLKNKNMLALSKSGRIKILQCKTHDVKLAAFEAKIKKWRQALYQAIQYKQFADKVYVILHEQYSRPALAARREFVKNGVGLVVFNDKNLYYRVRPRINKDFNWRRYYICSRLIKGESK